MPDGARGAPARERPDSRGRRSPSLTGNTGRLLVALFSATPRRTTAALFFLLAAGITEAFGIVLLVPLLYAAGLGESAGQNPVVEAMLRAARAVGVEPTVLNVLGVFLALVALREVTSWQRNRLMTEVRHDFVDGLRAAIYRATAGARWRFLLRQQRSDLQHVLTDNMTRAGDGAEVLLQLLSLSVFALAQTALALLISPFVAGAALAAGTALVLLARFFGRRSHELGGRLTDGHRALHRAAADFLAALKLVRSQDAEEQPIRRSAAAAAAVRGHRLALVRAQSAVAAGLHLGATASVAALIWLAVSVAALALADLLILALIFVRLIPLLIGLMANVHRFAHLLPACSHAREFHHALAAESEPAGPAEPAFALRTGLSLRDVWFGYDETRPSDPVLEDIALEVPAGKITVIAGPSGAGKTTLADLLLGLIEPDMGEVRADGVLLTGLNRRSWRRRAAYVPQDPFLFPDTIRANLQWARPDASEAEMWEALRLAAAEFVAAAPEGLDTLVGDRGARLSGGEAQRLTLARALLRRPDLLILDEPTSQLDAETERRIVASLHSLRGRMTIVAVAHRTALAEAADQIVLLESGRIAAAGTWSELSARIRAIEGAPAVQP